MLISQILETTTKAVDVFSALFDFFFISNVRFWEKVVSVYILTVHKL